MSRHTPGPCEAPVACDFDGLRARVDVGESCAVERMQNSSIDRFVVTAFGTVERGHGIKGATWGDELEGEMRSPLSGSGGGRPD